MDLSLLIAIVVIALAILLLIWIWITSSPNEQSYKEEFNKYIQTSLKEYVFNHRLSHRDLNDLIEEVSLDQPVQINSDQQLLVFGINHFSVLRAPWVLCVDWPRQNSPNHQELNHQEIIIKTPQKFWTQMFSTWPERESVQVPENAPLEIYENVWTSRTTLLPRAFRVPLPGSLEFQIDSVHRYSHPSSSE